MDRINEILYYWFGPANEDALPSEHRTRIWFEHDAGIDAEIKAKFYADFAKAMAGELTPWEETSRGSLAFIILLDQFSRHIFRDQARAFEQDQAALALCFKGIERQLDHELSLIERAFFYFPLMHTEHLDTQMLSLRAYKMLSSLSFPEVKPIYEKFLEYAVRHYQIIEKFGRFPHRNEILGRSSTAEELEFLNEQPSFD